MLHKESVLPKNSKLKRKIGPFKQVDGGDGGVEYMKYRGRIVLTLIILLLIITA
jgi:hypothetical protein